MTVEIPDQVVHLDIIVDLDQAGEQAAAVAGNRLSRESRHIRLVRPSRGNDLNDVLQQRVAQ
jgi:hypothetical protein